MSAAYSHTTVLLQETVSALPLQMGRYFVDGTLGGAGHTEQLLEQSKATVIGIDRDDIALTYSKKRLERFGERVVLVKDEFKNIKAILETLQIAEIDGAILDLGVSSFQLDDKTRGFSYHEEAPIDMRMDREAALSAEQVVNEYEEEALKRIIYQYGEERFAPRIARAIVAARPIVTTTQLAEIIKNAIPAANRRKGPHPARRTFQAIRIEVNEELSMLEQALQDFIEVLASKGRLAVITFHSLEDRIVKNTFRTAMHPCTCPPDFPICVCGKTPLGKVITRKPIVPSAGEVEENNRARSAKLRIFEKI
ncbi:MAG: 16S rRNA (cytosine(1402)-N(4))-methyltransferase RsmH [Christensenellaceae bacterium]|jgi:16S rRNA (cytosine1402-N4)-methyltransferase